MIDDIMEFIEYVARMERRIISNEISRKEAQILITDKWRSAIKWV